MAWDNKREIEKIIRGLEGISFQGQRVLVTGGAGFLGSWICESLIHMSADVICLDNLASGLRSNISHLMDSSRFHFIEHDISEPISFEDQAGSGYPYGQQSIAL